MAYSGSTAASSVANPPRLLVGQFAGLPGSTGWSTAITQQRGFGGNVWFYGSTHTSTEIQTATFFTDGWFLGMRAGDLLFSAHLTSVGSTMTLQMGLITNASTSGCGPSTGSCITSSFS